MQTKLQSFHQLVVTLSCVFLLSPSPTKQSSISVSSPTVGGTIPTSGTIDLNNAFPQTAATLQGNINSCSGTCVNPYGTYTCTIDSTNPATAIYHMGTSTTVNLVSTGSSITICSVYVYNSLNTTDYIVTEVGVNIKISFIPESSCSSSCNPVTSIVSYTMSITPATTSTSTTTTTTTTSTTTSTSTTSTTTTPTTTTATTSTSTRSTQVMGAGETTTVTETSTNFIESPGGIATVVVACIVGVAVIATITYFSVAACIAAGSAATTATSATKLTTIAGTSASKTATSAPTNGSGAQSNSNPTYNSYANAKAQSNNWNGTPQPTMNNSSYYGQIPPNTMASLNM